MTRWSNSFDSLTINHKDFDEYPIIYHKPVMVHLSKVISICISVVNDNLVQLQIYCEEFIFPLKHHTQSTEAGVQDIATWSATGRSEEDASTLVALSSTDIAPINSGILKQFEGRNRKGNSQLQSGVVDKRQPISIQSKRKVSSGAENPLSKFHPTSDKRQIPISCSSTNIPI